MSRNITVSLSDVFFKIGKSPYFMLGEKLDQELDKSLGKDVVTLIIPRLRDIYLTNVRFLSSAEEDELHIAYSSPVPYFDENKTGNYTLINEITKFDVLYFKVSDIISQGEIIKLDLGVASIIINIFRE